MKMKKVLALVLALAMTFSLAACTNNNGASSETPSNELENSATGTGLASEITLWTYPIGDWGDEAAVKTLTDAFESATGIKVTVEYLTYANGDDTVNSALTGGKAPDLIMEGPERLVANWGAAGHMVDLSDMLDDTDKQEIQEAVLKACINDQGAMYEYPLVMTAHCMAINLNSFKEAGADQYLDLENHTWTTENFIKAVDALYAKYNDTVAAVYCKGQGGDQGTRALVNNLYGGTFTNSEHTSYTWDDPKNIQALEQLKNMKGINFDASLEGGDEIALFYQGVLKMAFCWNIAQQLDPNNAKTGAGLTVNGEEIVFMGFPSESGQPALQGGIWGFGVFNNGDESKIAAAKEFIKYMCNSEHTVDAIKTAKYFPVRTKAGDTDLSTIWSDNEVMDEYQVLMPFLGDFYQVTQGWTQSRTSWWNMLQEIGNGSNVADSVAKFAAEANQATQ